MSAAAGNKPSIGGGAERNIVSAQKEEPGVISYCVYNYVYSRDNVPPPSLKRSRWCGSAEIQPPSPPPNNDFFFYPREVCSPFPVSLSRSPQWLCRHGCTKEGHSPANIRGGGGGRRRCYSRAPFQRRGPGGPPQEAGGPGQEQGGAHQFFCMRICLQFNEGHLLFATLVLVGAIFKY